jgi:hypothetical protein
MGKLTPEEEKQKRLIFESMSPRRRRMIEKRGYDNWDPFMMPKEPPFMKGFEKKKGLPDNPLELYHYYMRRRQEANLPEEMSNQYREGIMEACQFIKIHEERIKAHHDFYAWYRAEKDREEKE